MKYRIIILWIVSDEEIMRIPSRILDDAAKVGLGILGLVAGIKDEVKNRGRTRLENYADRLDLVTRQEFEIVRDMAQQARMQVEKLESNIDSNEPQKRK